MTVGGKEDKIWAMGNQKTKLLGLKGLQEAIQRELLIISRIEKSLF